MLFPVAPSFLLDSAEETRILKAGTATVIELPFKASPQLKVSWTVNGKNIKEKRIETETIRNMTCLRLSKAKREDSGPYKVVLSNDFSKRCEKCFQGWLYKILVMRLSMMESSVRACRMTHLIHIYYVESVKFHADGGIHPPLPPPWSHP